MSAQSDRLVMWLQQEQDPEALVRFLCKPRPRFDDLCHQLEEIKLLWCKMYGDNVVKSSHVYQEGIKSVQHYVRETLQDQKSSTETASSIAHFLQLSYVQQNQLQVQGVLQHYTGYTAVNDMLQNLIALPPYVRGLRVMCSQVDIKRSRCDNATSPDGETPPNTCATAAPIAGLKRKQTETRSPPAIDRHHKGEHALSDGVTECSPQTQLVKMLEVLQYSRAKPFELVCALAFVSGRSLAELMVLGQFSKSVDAQAASWCHTVLFRVGTTDTTENHAITLLCDAGSFLAGVTRLRRMKAADGKQCKQVNKSHCKTANTAAKALLGCSTAVFTDLRAYYAALTYTMSANRKLDSTPATELQAWTAECMPLTRITKSVAFIAKCQHLVEHCGMSASLPAGKERRLQAGDLTVESASDLNTTTSFTKQQMLCNALTVLLRMHTQST